MMQEHSREELIALVRRIMNVEGSEEEIDGWMEELRASVPHPRVSDLIFHDVRGLSPAEIVDEALGYRPIPLPESFEE